MNDTKLLYEANNVIIRGETFYLADTRLVVIEIEQSDCTTKAVLREQDYHYNQSNIIDNIEFVIEGNEFELIDWDDELKQIFNDLEIPHLVWKEEKQ